MKFFYKYRIIPYGSNMWIVQKNFGLFYGGWRSRDYPFFDLDAAEARVEALKKSDEHDQEVKKRVRTTRAKYY